ncbi:hypothetical protein [Nocardia sp. NPDC004604]|uniref:hypothetical protein n=1 Tax=Nocardia sp. NPDC004604 TaxID=3157013 RepID=UPI0033A19CF2
MVTTILSTAGIAIAVVTGIWLLGDIIARWSGMLLAVAGVGYMIGGLVRGAVMAAIGLLLWLIGHWIFAYKYHGWKSALAQRLFTTTRLRRFDPTRGWAIPVTDSGQADGFDSAYPSSGM